jgi:hypothetical protein
MSFLQKIFKEDSLPPPEINVQTLFYLFVIVLAAFKQLHGVQQHLDIPFFDETEYLQKGIHIPQHIFNDWGPSYNLWYFIVSKFSADAVQTFYHNYCILMVLIPALLFLFLIHYQTEKNLALLLSLSFLMHPLLVSNFTYVSHFCLCVILLAFIIVAKSRRIETKIITAFTASYICLYARQEFLLITASLSLLWLLLIIYQKKISWSKAYLVMVFFMALLYVVFGFISFKAQGIDRSLFAFKQHFYTNYVFWTKEVLTVDEFDRLDIFRGSKTMLQCLQANPPMFFKHMGTNILNYFLGMFKYTEDFLLPPPIFHFLGKGKHILYLLFNGFLLYLIFWKRAYRNVTDFIRQYSSTSVIILLFWGWSYFAVFFIFPERHYIILHFCWWIGLLTLLLKGHVTWLNNKLVFYPIILLIILTTPTAKSIRYYHNMLTDRDQQPNLKTVNYLKKHNSKKPVVLFTTERGFNAYLPKNYQELFLEQDDVRPYIQNGDIDIQQFFTDKNVGIIFMNEKLQSLVKQTLGDKGKILLNEPEKMGYRKTIIDKNLQAYLLIKI